MPERRHRIFVLVATVVGTIATTVAATFAGLQYSHAVQTAFLGNDTASMVQRITELEHDVEDRDRQLSDQSQLIKDQEMIIQSLEEGTISGDSSVRDLQNQVTELRNENVNLGIDNRKLRSENDEVITEKANLNGQVCALREQLGMPCDGSETSQDATADLSLAAPVDIETQLMDAHDQMAHFVEKQERPDKILQHVTSQLELMLEQIRVGKSASGSTSDSVMFFNLIEDQPIYLPDTLISFVISDNNGNKVYTGIDGKFSSSSSAVGTKFRIDTDNGECILDYLGSNYPYYRFGYYCPEEEF